MKKNSQFNNSALLNNSTYIDYLNRFKKIATSIFEWENLPETCDQRWLELCLFNDGKASFLFDNDLGFINTHAIPSSQLNIYGLPTKINCWSYNYQSNRDLYVGDNNFEKNDVKDDNECILVMNNYDMVSTLDTLQLFALRLYEAERTIDTNIKAQKTPIMILCNDKQRLTFKNLFMQYDGNYPFIFGDKKLLTEGNQIKSLSTEAPFIADKIMEYKKQIWNEALTFLRYK